ncbi:hypothetical protein [Corynebacterium caspium]|uniref:hypothetical protein n=1 Tax=Corynebacterium caspium TaxID=234828 RepID=UPI00036CA725|nr:hypothetical protein [Corynebacterium caspium]WKD58630.1 hypothetical protein CCASP_01020 [Corynebacterium caspium DSM 44850]
MDGFLQQSDGEVAGIAAAYIKSSTDDIALIKVGRGINADPFQLADQSLENNNLGLTSQEESKAANGLKYAPPLLPDILPASHDVTPAAENSSSSSALSSAHSS